MKYTVINVDGSSEDVVDGDIEDVLSSPIASVSVRSQSSTLMLTYSLLSLNEDVNEVASRLCGQEVHGDCVVSESSRCWASGLPTGLLYLIATCLGSSNASAMLPLLGVNRGWRCELINDHRFLRAVNFQLRNPWAPLVKTSQPQDNVLDGTASKQRVIFGFKLQQCPMFKMRISISPPSILHLSSKAGNVGAAAVLAAFHDAARDREEAARWWGKAARGGDTEALFHHGFYLYSSDQLEDAASYLSRAIKTVLGVDLLTQVPSLPPSGVSSDLPLSELLSRASLILAYMHLDGHGLKADNEIAVKLFRLAGCNEGQRALGWLYRTGQF